MHGLHGLNKMCSAFLLSDNTVSMWMKRLSLLVTAITTNFIKLKDPTLL